MKDPLWSLMGMLYQSHPWHGVPIGKNAPEQVTAYIEIVPSDTVKYEVDKVSGHLKVDRPQLYSNICPSLYGFVPQTLCAKQVAELARQRTGRTDIIGDDDPLDICVLTERNISMGKILVQAIPIGGFRMVDHNEADDKIIAVLQGDNVYGGYQDISDCPEPLIDRLKHYFLTYKQAPGEEKAACEISHVYGREEALDVIRRSQADYNELFSGLEDLLTDMLKNRREN
jgi:inorganic pyrophosphatase